jgi:hypothetical protein
LIDDARALVDAGVFSVVLEGVPDEVAGIVTDAIDVPTIGIGAGPHCDGQVLVFHDVLGIEDRITPKFVRRYASLKEEAVRGLSDYAADVRAGRFPGPDESYHLADGVAEALGLYGHEASAGGPARSRPLARQYPRPTWGARHNPKPVLKERGRLGRRTTRLQRLPRVQPSNGGIGQPRAVQRWSWVSSR